MSLTEILIAALLGVVQGITEFLPVSSSAHLIIVSSLIDGKSLPLTLNIALHIGTLMAVLLYFWRDWWQLLWDCRDRLFLRKRSFGSDVLLPSLLVGSLPAGLIGILWQDDIEALFHHPLATVLPLALVGIVLWLADRFFLQKQSLESLRLKDAFLIGIAQATALIPGVSRSGATILAGRCLGFDRDSAARFSFLLGTPAMAGAALLNHKELAISLEDPSFYVGCLTATGVGCLAISFLLKFIKKYGFGAFAIYRVLVALVLIGLFLGR